MEDFDYDYESMSKKDLIDLKGMIQQSLIYYKELLEDPTKMEGASEDDMKAIELCKKTMQDDMDAVEKELAKRE